MKVIYHANCTDGFTAAFVAWLKYGDAPEYIPAQYGDEPPDVTNHDVLVVDFSYPRDALLKMHADATAFRVLDHHKTAQAELEGLPFCTFDMGRSGAGLAWDELFGSERPPLIAYVEDRDLWAWRLPFSREVSAWLSSFKHDFQSWADRAADLSRDLEGCARQGAAVLRTLNGYVDGLSDRYMLAVIGGHMVPLVNTTYAISELVGRLASDAEAKDGSPFRSAPFAAGWFQRQDGKFVYSLRSRGEFDVSAIAKQYGGGGHRNAAGFTTEKLIHG